MPITLTPITASDNLVSTARAVQIATLATLQAASADTLANILAAASEAIRDACHREFNHDSYTEYADGMGYPPQLIQLKEFPVTAITRVATNPEALLTVKNTVTTNQIATVRTTSTGIILSRTASGVASTSTILYANEVTLDALVTAIDALGNGWDATVASTYGSYPSVDLKPTQGAFSAKSDKGGAELFMYLEDVNQWTLDAGAGQLWGSFPRGTQNLRIDYTAGFTAVPDPIQQATAMLAADIYSATQRDGSFSDVKIGPYAHKLAVREVLVASPAIRALIAPYVDHGKVLA